MNFDIVNQLCIEISKAYRLAHIQVPPLDQIRQEASLIYGDFVKSYSHAYLIESYEVARLHGQSNIPTIRTIVYAYLNTVKTRLDEEARKKPLLSYNRNNHSCNYCPVVAIRLLGSIPEQTQWEIDMASKEPSHKEIECIRNSAGIMINYWNTKSNSPYRGLL